MDSAVGLRGERTAAQGHYSRCGRSSGHGAYHGTGEPTLRCRIQLNWLHMQVQRARKPTKQCLPFRKGENLARDLLSTLPSAGLALFYAVCGGPLSWQGEVQNADADAKTGKDR